MNDVLISEVVRRVLDKLNVDLSDPTLVVAGVSNRHIHLTAVDVKILFGEDYTLTKLRDLRQPGQYACKETVTLVAPGGVLENVRILGPIRKSTQVEMAMSDAIRLHIDIPLIKSGSSHPCPPIIVLGPKGHIVLTKGVGMARRHLHLSPAEAQALGLKDGQEIDVEVRGDRGLIFKRVWVRVGPDMISEFHVDIDEANACSLKTGDYVRVLV